MYSLPKKSLGIVIALTMVLMLGASFLTFAKDGYDQAPMLDPLVKKGELPPVEKRLPVKEDLVVVKPVEEVGDYGGTWNRVFFGPADYHAYGRLNYDPITRFPKNPKEGVKPGIIKDWESKKGGKIWYLYLREGIRWSDGYPFTSEDILFWWEDIANDENITPSVPVQWVTGGEPMEVTAVDDYTVKLEFEKPNGIVPILLAHIGPQWPRAFERFGFYAPKHYLDQFHPKYNPTSTYDKFENKAFDLNPELPVLTAWQVVKREPGEKLVAERNPYYWKVDTEGNQLPYIDRIELDIVDKKETVQAKAMAGELDMQGRHIDITQLPTFKDRAEKGNYRVLLWPSAWPGNPQLLFNHNTQDPVLHKLFQEPKFKKALSYAIDRKHINETVYWGLGKPRIGTVVPSSPYYQEDLAQKYTEYDPEKAKELLEEIGMTEKGPDGFRLSPDGEKFSVVINISQPAWPGFMDALEFVMQDWKDIGINTVLNPVERSTFVSNGVAGKHEVATWQTGQAIEPMVMPNWWLPIHTQSWMAPLYAKWYTTGGKKGVKPKGDFARVIDLYEEIKTTSDRKEQIRLFKKIERIHFDKNLWTVGVVGMQPMPFIVKNYFRNVPEKATADWVMRTPGNQHPEQFFIRKAAQE